MEKKGLNANKCVINKNYVACTEKDMSKIKSNMKPIETWLIKRGIKGKCNQPESEGIL